MKSAAAKSRIEKTLLEVRSKYGVIDRPFTEEDFYRIAEGEGIYLVTPEEIPEINLVRFESLGGWYARFKVENLKVIYLRSFYVGPFDVFVAFHELGHHFLNHRIGNMDDALLSHRPESPYHQNELDADEFAALATVEVRNA